MNNEVFKSIIIALIPLIGLIISMYILPAIRNFIDEKLSKEEIERMNMIFQSVTNFINKMVKAMEQEHPDWQGADKKKEVLTLTIDYIAEFFGINASNIDVKFISEVIEGIVKEVKHPIDNNTMTFVVDSVETNNIDSDDLK